MDSYRRGRRKDLKDLSRGETANHHPEQRPAQTIRALGESFKRCRLSSTGCDPEDPGHSVHQAQRERAFVAPDPKGELGKGEHDKADDHRDRHGV